MQPSKLSSLLAVQYLLEAHAKRFRGRASDWLQNWPVKLPPTPCPCIGSSWGRRHESLPVLRLAHQAILCSQLVVHSRFRSRLGGACASIPHLYRILNFPGFCWAPHRFLLKRMYRSTGNLNFPSSR
jgi:hypothetical protein